MLSPQTNEEHVMTALGLIAGVFTTACWIPQLARSLRTRSTDDLSWIYLAVFAVGVTLWLAYGLLRGDLALILSNMFALACVLTLGTVKSLPARAAA
jgi:MtN3 and saliva related transmembrane protein